MINYNHRIETKRQTLVIYDNAFIMIAYTDYVNLSPKSD